MSCLFRILCGRSHGGGDGFGGDSSLGFLALRDRVEAKVAEDEEEQVQADVATYEDEKVLQRLVVGRHYMLLGWNGRDGYLRWRLTPVFCCFFPFFFYRSSGGGSSVGIVCLFSRGG